MAQRGVAVAATATPAVPSAHRGSETADSDPAVGTVGSDPAVVGRVNVVVHVVAVVVVAVAAVFAVSTAVARPECLPIHALEFYMGCKDGKGEEEEGLKGEVREGLIIDCGGEVSEGLSLCCVEEGLKLWG